MDHLTTVISTQSELIVQSKKLVVISRNYGMDCLTISTQSELTVQCKKLMHFKKLVAI
jgi:hypothetical protein